MAEAGDYTAAPWAATHDFKSARAVYDKQVGRSYDEARVAGTKAADLVPANITTKSGHPMLVQVDVTGSMQGWPNTIFEKMGYMDHELRTEYLGDDYELSFGAISDTDDDYPLQIQPFVKGADLPKSLEKLLVTNGGAGSDQYHEAHGLAALYDIRNVRMPKSLITPPLIIITDEMPHGTVTKKQALEFAKVDIEESRLTIDKLFRDLQDVYSVYLILKPYESSDLSGDHMDGVTKTVYRRWKEILGAERIALLSQERRVLDVIFGIMAQETGRVDYFRKELEDRQKPEQVATVYESLNTIHNFAPPKSRLKLPPGRSVLHSRSKKS